jgi:hypothetical protein
MAVHLSGDGDVELATAQLVNVQRWSINSERHRPP